MIRQYFKDNALALGIEYNNDMSLNDLKRSVSNKIRNISNSEKKDLTQNLETNYEQEKTNLASNAYQISENNNLNISLLEVNKSISPWMDLL